MRLVCPVDKVRLPDRRNVVGLVDVVLREMPSDRHVNDCSASQLQSWVWQTQQSASRDQGPTEPSFSDFVPPLAMLNSLRSVFDCGY